MLDRSGASKSRRTGFTLIELLVVIAIIAILAAILFPVLMSSKERARTAKCISNLKQLYSAMHTYCADNHGRLPHTYLYKPCIFKYVRNDQVFFCPNDIGHQFDHSYALNGRLLGQPVDSPICSSSYGCGRSVRQGDHSWYHYLLVEYPRDPRPEYRRMGHYDGRPFCYLDGGIKWRRDELPKGTGHVPE